MKSIFISICLLCFFFVQHGAAALEKETISVSGKQRVYSIHEPEDTYGEEVPLLIILHASDEEGNSFAHDSDWFSLAEIMQFYVVTPEALPLSTDPDTHVWNAGSDTSAWAGFADDVTFLDTLIDHLLKKYKFSIDPQSIFITGQGEGACMAYYYASRTSHKIAALVTSGGCLLESLDSRVPPTQIIHVSGMNDDVYPYYGGTHRTMNIPAYEDSIKPFIQANRCSGSEVKEENDHYIHLHWTSPQGKDIDVYKIKNWGHEWPNAKETRIALPDISWSILFGGF
ncbi:MAG: hypothetical protein JW739_08330 [Opitutales bacterium]|nr:hypothetical protein [Opitutales bacterium]